LLAHDGFFAIQGSDAPLRRPAARPLTC
jgi:hypothetical protein